MEPFRYFANPTQPLSSWRSEAQPCHYCGVPSPGFDGPFYGLVNVDRVCETCLRTGRLEGDDLSTTEGDQEQLRAQLYERHPELPELHLARLVQERTAELQHRTPALQSWQDFRWPAHCGDYCVFLEELGKPEILELAHDQDAALWFLANARDASADVWSAVREDSAREHPSRSYDLTVYRFGCRQCGATVLHWDAS